MKIKKLDLNPESKGIKSIIHSQHFIKSLIAIFVGSLAGFGYFYLTEGQHMDTVVFKDAIQSILLGAFLGFFVTNSPCARNKC